MIHDILGTWVLGCKAHLEENLIEVSRRLKYVSHHTGKQSCPPLPQGGVGH